MKEYNSSDIKELAAALAVVHSKMEPAKKDSANPHFKSSYADIRSVVEVSRKLLSDSGLVVTQIVDYEGENIFIITQLTHSSGQWMRSWYPVRPTKNDPQSLGSAITYARRYSYCALIGVVADDDDDGNEASEKPEKQAAPQKPPAKASSVFDTAEALEQYVANCVDAINKAESLDRIRDLRDLEAAKRQALKTSECPADRDAFNRIAAAQKAMVEKLPAPKTVEDAKKNPADALSGDTIPY